MSTERAYCRENRWGLRVNEELPDPTRRILATASWNRYRLSRRPRCAASDFGALWRLTAECGLGGRLASRLSLDNQPAQRRLSLYDCRHDKKEWTL